MPHANLIAACFKNSPSNIPPTSSMPNSGLKSSCYLNKSLKTGFRKPSDKTIFAFKTSQHISIDRGKDFDIMLLHD